MGRASASTERRHACALSRSVEGGKLSGDLVVARVRNGSTRLRSPRRGGLRRRRQGRLRDEARSRGARSRPREAKLRRGPQRRCEELPSLTSSWLTILARASCIVFIASAPTMVVSSVSSSWRWRGPRGSPALPRLLKRMSLARVPAGSGIHTGVTELDELVDELPAACFCHVEPRRELRGRALEPDVCGRTGVLRRTQRRLRALTSASDPALVQEPAPPWNSSWIVGARLPPLRDARGRSLPHSSTRAIPPANWSRRLIKWSSVLD